MTDDRLSALLRISREALERDGADRAAYLDSACGADVELRREVETLIAEPADHRRSLLDTPPWAPPPLAAGHRLGPYEILGRLGAGGMGTVYRARDTRLGRRVAVKVLSGASAIDPADRDRFTQEARAVAALNHPHICTLHDTGRDGGIDYFVMEELEGETLATRLEKARGRTAVASRQAGEAPPRPLPLTEALTIAAQIADALAAAHQQGIVHRDLKPANVMLTTGSGIGGTPRVKLLDFGLAKFARTPAWPASGLAAASSDRPRTTPGLVMGTVPYMAPEQLEGKEVDARADIFSFGCVLYEMLAGRRAFAGDSGASVVSAIMTSEPPPLRTLQPDTPAALDRLVRRCLAKHPDARWQSAADLADELRWLQDASSIGAAGGAISAAPAAGHPRPAWWKFAVPAMALLVITACGYLLYARTRPILTDRDVIVLAEFVNRTGDTAFVGTLKTYLTVQLDQSPFLSILPEQSVRETLREMRRSPDARVTAELARDICQRQGLKAALEGSIAVFDSQYLITVQAKECQSGASLFSDAEHAESKNAVPAALNRLASRLRRGLGESLASMQKHPAPVDFRTTSSLDAFEAYSRGVEVDLSGRSRESIAYYQRAIELDPSFASAYQRAANRYAFLGDSTLAEEYTRKAYELRDRVPENGNEWYYITSSYHLQVDGDLIKEIELAGLWKSAYPRSWPAAQHLAGAYGRVGRFEDAIEQYHQVMAAAGSGPIQGANLAEVYIALNRLDEAKALCQRTLEKSPELERFHGKLYRIALLQGDAAGARAERDRVRGKDPEVDFIAVDRRRAAQYGQFALSLKLARDADALAGRQPTTGSGIEPTAQAFVGNLDIAQKEALAALEDAKGARVKVLKAALALALTGDAARAERLAADFGSRFPVDTLLQATAIPAVRASIELTRKNPQKAIDLLNPARRYDRGEFTCPYLRGMAFLQAGSAAEAAAEFQKVIDRRSERFELPLQETSILWPLSHLGKARALALGGDVAASRKAYEVFLTLWKDADPGIPILKEAKAEYAKLK